MATITITLYDTDTGSRMRIEADPPIDPDRIASGMGTTAETMALIAWNAVAEATEILGGNVKVITFNEKPIVNGGSSEPSN